MIYSATCEGSQFRVNNIKHECVNLGKAGSVMAGAAPSLSAPA